MSVDSTFDNNFERRGVELDSRRRVEPQASHPLSSRSLPLRLAAILGRLFSSLLPPSFARGRFATLFFAPALAGPALNGGARPARA